MNLNNNEKSIRGSSLELDEQNNLDHISLERKNTVTSRMGKKAKVLEKLTSISPFLEQTQNAIDTDICSHRDANASEISKLKNDYCTVIIITGCAIIIDIDNYGRGNFSIKS